MFENNNNNLIPIPNNSLNRVNTQLSTTNKILVKVGEQGLREWWDGLSEEWKEIFLINLEFATKLNTEQQYEVKKMFYGDTRSTLGYDNDGGCSLRDIYEFFFGKRFNFGNIFLEIEYIQKIIQIDKICIEHNSNPTVNSLTFLNPVEKLINLKELYFPNAYLGFRGKVKISPLKNLTNLEILNLSGDTTYSNAAAIEEDLPTIKNLVNLKELRLAVNTYVNLDFLKYLIKLEILDLFHSTLFLFQDDDSPLFLYNKQLRYLDLRLTNINNTVDFSILQNLTVLNLYRCEGYTLQDVEILRKKLPNCEITF